MAVPIAAKGTAIAAGSPQPLFELRLAVGGRNRYVVTRDGQRFLINNPIEDEAAEFSVLVKRVGARK